MHRVREKLVLEIVQWIPRLARYVFILVRPPHYFWRWRSFRYPSFRVVDRTPTGAPSMGRSHSTARRGMKERSDSLPWEARKFLPPAPTLRMVSTKFRRRKVCVRE